MIDGWRTNKLRDILEFVYGRSLSKQTRKDGTVPVYGSNGIVGYHNEAFVNQEGIIIGRKGSAGNVAYSKIPFCPIDTTFFITQAHTILDLEFLFYALEKLDLKRILGDVGVPGLNREMAYLEELSYPNDRNEQRKIAYVLSLIQTSIEQQDKLIQTTTELKKALMQKLFTEGTKGEKQKQTEIGLVPVNWEVVELNKVCEKPQYGFTDSASAQGNAKFLRITDITEYGVNWKNVPYCNCNDFEKYKLQDGDIVFARIGATTGKSYLISNPPKSVYASYLIRVRCIDTILPDYLIYYFSTEQYWKQIDATKGNNLKGGVNGSILSKLLIPIPSLPEQRKIADTFNALDKKIANALRKKESLSDLFKTLLHELMTGQRRVNKIDFCEQALEYKLAEPTLSIAAEN